MGTAVWATGISIASAIVAITSAFLAHRARIQTRTDIFESQRDTLILAMADNDIRCSQLVLQAAFARSELERVLLFVADGSAKEQANAYRANVAAIEKVPHSLDGREYNVDNLDDLKYSEEALAPLRRMGRGEQVNAKQLAAESYDLIFKHIERFVSKHERRT